MMPEEVRKRLDDDWDSIVSLIGGLPDDIRLVNVSRSVNLQTTANAVLGVKGARLDGEILEADLDLRFRFVRDNR